jgi:pilus assembly protein CpaF
MVADIFSTGWISQRESRESAMNDDQSLPQLVASASGDLRLTPTLIQVLDAVRRELAWRFDESASSSVPAEARELMTATARVLGMELSSFEIEALVSQLENEWRPYGILQPLIDDPSISDIIVSGYSVISAQKHRRNLRTGIAFPDQRSLEVYVERLMSKAGTSCTTKQPIADGMIGAEVRVHAVHNSLCENGPYLTIRVNRFSSVTTDDLTRAGMAPSEVFEYLKGAVSSGQTIMLVGEVGTGKTTLARALAGAIPEDESILVIEDTPEIRLQHPHVRYISTRGENIEGEGRVNPAQCIRAGMRMAMNRIIFGEIRDAEAAEAFVDVCTSGHAGVSTLHGRTVADALTRLELFLGRAQRGADQGVLLGQIAAAVQVIARVDLCPRTQRRRIMEVREIGPYADGVLRSREMFGYVCDGDVPRWRTVTRISAFRDRLESAKKPVVLSRYAPEMELPMEAAYFEYGRSAA